jgi:hypothetical protein
MLDAEGFEHVIIVQEGDDSFPAPMTYEEVQQRFGVRSFYFDEYLAFTVEPHDHVLVHLNLGVPFIVMNSQGVMELAFGYEQGELERERPENDDACLRRIVAMIVRLFPMLQ